MTAGWPKTKKKRQKYLTTFSWSPLRILLRSAKKMSLRQAIYVVVGEVNFRMSREGSAQADVDGAFLSAGTILP